MSWTDYSQNVRIRELQEDLSGAYSQMARDRSRMRSELGRIRGTLEQRLDRVSATLDAFIELSDVRATLAMFDNAAITRHRTLQMLDGAALPSLDLEDVHGYWLVPAARGLHALLRDDINQARLRFDEAAGIDLERARYFTALACALTRSEYARTLGESVSADLLPHLPEPGVQLNRGQRALWILTADGSFGDDAREHLLLSTLQLWSAEGVQVPPVDEWSASPGSSSGRSGGRKPSLGTGKLSTGATTQRQAAAAIAHLREQVAKVTALGSEDTPLETLSPDEASSDFLRDTLRLLVEEGSQEEAPLLAQANRLRAVIENSGQEGALPAWTDTVDSVGALLRRDLTSESAPPHRRTFSLMLQRTAVLETAEDLMTRAGAPLPEKAEANFHGVKVNITASGAERRDVERSHQRLRDRSGPEQGKRSAFWVYVSVGAGLFVLSLLTMNGVLWFLTVCTAVASGVTFFAAERERDDAEAMFRNQSRKLDQQVDQAVQDWRRVRTEAEEYAAAARSDLAEVHKLLNP
ncbi:hypothetical protein [Nocardiopsis valliformis]|uniref:hypothetical protein n=1 Tax=Nocardiopsis valliformis TaxID=239974 RepID=UPI0003499F8F|nr:hypothetical protein [Nocardiopsis valliformis]